MISKALITTLLKQSILPRNSAHGISHWARVFDNGYQLAQLNQANIEVIQLFALFHDAKRVNDGRDFGHGHRGAEYAASLRGTLFNLPDEEFDLLYTACAQHTNGKITDDITIQTCWDADRLDLGRIGIRPHPKYLGTDAAKNPDMIFWATQRARKHIPPKWVYKEWGMNYFMWIIK